MVASIARSAVGELAWIVRKLLAHQFQIDDIEVFVFGSVQRQQMPHSDIDVLVTYTSMDELKHVQSALRELGAQLPLDVTYMDRVEEAELNFIENQHCERIFPAWSWWRIVS